MEVAANSPLDRAMMALIVRFGSLSTTARALARFMPGTRASISTLTRCLAALKCVSPGLGVSLLACFATGG